jgi:hypothetical protein
MEWRVRTQTKALSTVFIRINGFSRLGLIPIFLPAFRTKGPIRRVFLQSDSRVDLHAAPPKIENFLMPANY